MFLDAMSSRSAALHAHRAPLRGLATALTALSLIATTSAVEARPRDVAAPRAAKSPQGQRADSESASGVEAPAPNRLSPPLPPPRSAEPKVVEPEPNQAAAAAPSSDSIAITATCTLGERNGVDESEAKTAADVVCHELARRGATNGQHEVRFGKLGARTMVTLASRNGNSYDERRTFISGMDEIDVAGPRLADALANNKPLDETRNVDNVLSSESRATKLQRGSSAFVGDLFGMTALNADGGSSAGVDVGFLYRAGALGIGAHGRLGGIGSSTNKVATASLDVGGRLYLSSGDTAPFLAGGVGLSSFSLARKNGADLDGSGLGSYVAVGVELLRTHHVGFSASARADLPFYALKGSGDTRWDTATAQYVRSADSSMYLVPVSINVGMIFH